MNDYMIISFVVTFYVTHPYMQYKSMIDNACLEPHVKVLVITKNPLSNLNSTTNRKQSIKQERPEFKNYCCNVICKQHVFSPRLR